MSKRLRNLLIGGTAAVGIYLLIGFFAVPAVVKSQLVAHVEQKLKHRITVGEVRFNPLKLSAEVNDLDLRDPDGGALVAFKRLHVDFETRSLIDWAWTFSEISLDQPALNVEIRPGGTLNFAALLDALKDPDRKESGPLPRLKLQRIAVTDGRVDLADRDQPEPAAVKFAPVAFELTDLSTVPEHRSPYAISARTTAGETIEWSGDMSVAPFSSTGKLAFKGWKVATLAAFLGERLNLAPPEGQVHAAASYRVAYSNGKVEATAEGGEVKIEGLSLAEPGGSKPLLALQSLALSDVRFDLSRRSLQVAALSLEAPRAILEVDKAGRGNWTRLLRELPSRAAEPASASSSAPDASAQEAAPWSIKVDAVNVAGAGLAYSAQEPSGPLALAFDGGGLALALAAEVGAQTNLALSRIKGAANTIAIRSGGTQAAVGKLAFASSGVQVATASGALSTTLDDVALDLAAVTASTPGAKADVATLASASAAAKSMQYRQAAAGPDVVADGLTLALTSVLVREPAQGRELARLATARIEGGALRLLEQRLAIERIALEDGAAQATIDGQGRLDWAALGGSEAQTVAAPASGTAAAPRAQTPGRTATAAAPAAGGWNVSVKAVELRGLDAGYSDQRSDSALSVGLVGISGRATDLGTDLRSTSRIELAARVKSGGQISIAGQVKPHVPEADLKVKVTELALGMVQPFLTDVARLKLTSGIASAEGRLRYGSPDRRGPQLVYDGAIGITKLLLDETDTGAPFLSFDSVATADMKLTVSPNRLDIGELRVDGLAAKLLIAEDQTVNLTKILNRPAVDPKGPAPKPAAYAKTPDPAPKPASDPPAVNDPFPTSIARIRVDRTRLEFSDLSLRPQFATRMHNLQGVITGVSTSRTSRARIQLEGQVDEFGLARIQGEISPFQPRVYTDIEMSFRNLEMTSLTPYSAKFAGYRIASGTLSLELQYKIRDSKLAAENKFVLDKLELGERVDSPTAMSLPLGLAIALLKDSDGRIDIGLPITGSLEDPEFSYGHLVWKAIGNLLTRIVTAPFRLIANLFGGSEEKLDNVEFDPGSDRLLPPEQQKLRTVAEALKKRPQLRLGVKPVYASTEDLAALRSVLVRREVVARMGIKLAEGEDPGPVDTENARSQQAIEALYTEKFTAAAARELRKTQEKAVAAATKAGAKPVAAPPGELQKAMLERLLGSAQIPESALADLARRRGEAVARELAGPGGIDAARVSVAAPTATDAASGKVVRTGLELQAAR